MPAIKVLPSNTCSPNLDRFAHKAYYLRQALIETVTEELQCDSRLGNQQDGARLSKDFVITSCMAKMSNNYVIGFQG